MATIERIAADFRSFSLRIPDGTLQDVDVRNPGHLKELKSGTVKEGDQIDITDSLSIAVSVEKAERPTSPE